jgi:uncharacterized protein YgiM (DUF1202 family)
MQALRLKRLKLTLLFFLFLFAISGVFPQPADQVVTLVDSFKVRVRATPQIAPDNVLASFFKGTQLRMTGEKDGWYQVRLEDGQTGWVHGDYGKIEAARDQLEVAVEVARIRAAPTIDSESIARAIVGQRLHLLEKVDNWYKVEIPNEMEGWMREDTVVFRAALSDSFQPAEEIAQESTADDPQTVNIEESSDTKEVAGASTVEVAPEPLVSEENSKGIVETPSNSLSSELSDLTTEVDIDWITVTIITGCLTALTILAFAFLRRRRLRNIHQIIKNGRSKSSELERTLVWEAKEAQFKLGDLDRKIKHRFADFRAAAPASTGLGSKTSEDLLNNIDQLRLVIQDQQKRMDLYSELVSLQNQQIEALKQENASIRKLLDLKNDS